MIIFRGSCDVRVGSEYEYPKINSIECIKSHIKMMVIELFNVDLTNPTTFPQHKVWWNKYKHGLKCQGKMAVKHHKPLPPQFLEKFQKLIILLFSISDSRGDDLRYEALLMQLPVQFTPNWNKLLGHCVQFMFQLFFVLRGQETIDKVMITNIERVESDSLAYAYYKLVKGNTDLRGEGSGGIMPCLDIAEGFNPGLLLEKYLALRPEGSVDYLFLCAKYISKKEQKELSNPNTVLFEPNRKIGKNHMTYMCKSIAEALGLPPKEYTNHRLRATGVQALKEAGFSLSDIAKFTGYKNSRSITRSFDTVGLEETEQADMAVAIAGASVLRLRE
jgi:hypothetical protein